MKKTLKIIAKIVSVIITLLVLIKLISLLSFIGSWFTVIFFVFRGISHIGWYIPGWILGFIGCVLNFGICKKICDTKFELILFRISAFFCMFVALFDLFILYVISQI